MPHVLRSVEAYNFTITMFCCSILTTIADPNKTSRSQLVLHSTLCFQSQNAEKVLKQGL